MEFNVSQLLKEAVGAVREYDVADWPNPPQDVNWTTPVSGHARLMRTNRGILVVADLEGRIRVECGRCLEPAETEIHMRIEEEFRPTIDVFTGALLPEPEDEIAFRIDERHTLDLSEAVRQYGLINEPLSALCRDDCAGLCPTCGVNRNLGRCLCRPEPVDSQWAPLRQLASKLADES